jgi:hypothetical protein
LKASSGSVTLWAIDSEAQGLWSLTDTLAAAVPVTLISPADGYQNPINPVSGVSQDISFSWNRPAAGTTSLEYQVKIYASDGTSLLTTGTRAATASSTPNLLIGPNQSSPEQVTWAAGETYYWKVRVNSPVYSPYSELRSFTIQLLSAQTQVAQVLAPVNGSAGIARLASFSWSPISGTTEYQFVLAENVGLGSPVVDAIVTSTGYALVTPLEYGKTYFWAVKPLAPVEGSWSAIANFTVMGEAGPAAPPPVIITQVPAPIITLPPPPAPPPDIVIPPAPAPPAPIAPAYIWAIIIIGAVLVIAVIVLIVRTRRSV